MLQREHSAIRSTFIKLPFVIMIFVLSIFEWALKTGFTVVSTKKNSMCILRLNLLIILYNFSTLLYMGKPPEKI